MSRGKMALKGTPILLAVATGLTLFLAACNSGSEKEKYFAKVLSEGDAHPGQVVFEGNCIRCHPYGKRGLGPNLSKKELTLAQVRKQVRKGGLIMPSFSEEEIDDEELGQVAEFVAALREKIGKK
jgi:mono/diheme cytochrome c family protein